MPYKNKETRKKQVDAYNKNYYLLNKEKIKERSSSSKKKYALRNNEFVKSYLSQKSCVDCGEKDIRVLEFDHVNGKKYNDVSTMVWRACSIKKIQNEINKCEIVCANCHRIRTWERKTKGDI
jgi:hypothetical protein